MLYNPRKRRPVNHSHSPYVAWYKKMGWQPIQIFFPAVSKGEQVAVRIDVVDRGTFHINPETQAIEVLTSAIETERTQLVAVDFAGNTSSFSVAIKPVRKLLVYVLPHSHTDIGYTDLQSAVEEKQVNNLKVGIALARKTAEYPEGSRFIWNVEVLWAVDLYLRRADGAAKRELLEAVRNGWVALNGMYTNELTGLCRPEELLQLFRYSTQLANEFALKIDSAMTGDVPGWTWGTVTAMSQAGIRYFSAAPNRFDRIGTLMEELQDRPFWWVSPSGKEKVLCGCRGWAIRCPMPWIIPRQNLWTTCSLDLSRSRIHMRSVTFAGPATETMRCPTRRYRISSRPGTKHLCGQNL